MNNYYSNIKKEKNKHLSLKMHKKIELEYNHYISSKNKEIGNYGIQKEISLFNWYNRIQYL